LCPGIKPHVPKGRKFRGSNVVVDTCNLSYSGGRQDSGLRPSRMKKEKIKKASEYEALSLKQARHDGTFL
jgi:hypothetical protein